MRKILVRRSPEVEVLDGSAESVPVDDALRRAVEWFQANGYASQS